MIAHEGVLSKVKSHAALPAGTMYGVGMGKQAFPPVSMPYYQDLETAQR
jgi:hypothetical protein